MIGIPSMLQAFAPIWVVAGSTLLLLLADTILMRVGAGDKESELGGVKGSFLSALTGFVLLAALAISALNFQFEPRLVSTPGSLLVVDSQASFAMALLCTGALLTLWLSQSALPEVGLHYGEFYPLLLFSLAGSLALVCAGNLVMLFVAMELVALPFYVLAGFDRARKRSIGAGLDAFSSGGFASALSLYGVALIYGATGHLDYPGIREALDRDLPMALSGIALLLVGLLTRVGAFPFHPWWPSVTNGAPVATAMFMPVAVSCASAFALMRVFEAIVDVERASTHVTVTILAGASMVVGSAMALREVNVKRLFAYAAVSHAGFLLVVLGVGSAEARFAAVLEVSTFLIMQVGALGVVATIATNYNRWECIDDYNGLAVRRPILAGAMVVLLLALAGLPGTSGFVSRISLLSVTLGDGQIVLALLMALASVLLFAAYLRIATAMYMKSPTGAHETPSALMAIIAIGICVVITLYLGIFPGQGPVGIDFLDIVRRAVHLR